MTSVLKRNVVSAALGAVSGVVLALTMLLSWGGYQWYKDNHGTVVAMEAKLVFHDTDSVLIHMYGEKFNSCRFLELTFFYVRPNEDLKYELNMRRLDRPTDRSSKPVGSFDIGFWLAEDVASGNRIKVFVNHDCHGVFRTTQIADVEIP